ncbi:hypothetical protein ACF0H5_004387 [Mactra antiquata]
MSVSVVIIAILATLCGHTAPALGAKTPPLSQTTDSVTGVAVSSTESASNDSVPGTDGTTSGYSAFTGETNDNVTTPFSTMTSTMSNQSTNGTLTSTIQIGGLASSTSAAPSSMWQNVAYALIGVLLILLIAFIISLVCTFKLKRALNKVNKTLYPDASDRQTTPHYLDMEVHHSVRKGNVELTHMNEQEEEEFETPALPSTPLPAKPPRKAPPPPVSKPPSRNQTDDYVPLAPDRRKRGSFKKEGFPNPGFTEDEVDATSPEAVDDIAYEVPVSKSATGQNVPAENTMLRQDSSTGLPDLSPRGIPSIPRKKKVAEPLEAFDSSALDNTGIPEAMHFDDAQYFGDFDSNDTNVDTDMDFSAIRDSFVDMLDDHGLEKQPPPNEDFAGDNGLDDLDQYESQEDLLTQPRAILSGQNETNRDGASSSSTTHAANGEDVDQTSAVLKTGKDLRGSRIGKPNNTYFLDVHDKTDVIDSVLTPEDIIPDGLVPGGISTDNELDITEDQSDQFYANQFEDFSDLSNDQLQPSYENFMFDNDDVDINFDSFNGTVPSTRNHMTDHEYSNA